MQAISAFLELTKLLIPGEKKLMSIELKKFVNDLYNLWIFFK